jgi:uncharacterized protein with PIN domain
MQASIFSFITRQEHRFKQLPQCIACQQRYTEKDFAALQQNGHNFVWNIDFAICQTCGGEVQGWLS